MQAKGRCGVGTSKKFWISAMVPSQGADVYGGVRIGVHKSKRAALEDLFEWCGDGADDSDDEGEDQDTPDDVHEMTNEDIREYLSNHREISHWAVEQKTIPEDKREVAVPTGSITPRARQRLSERYALAFAAVHFHESQDVFEAMWRDESKELLAVALAERDRCEAESMRMEIDSVGPDE